MDFKRMTKKELVEYAANALVLIDSAYNVVEIWQTEGKYNKGWKQEWLKRARVAGATSDW